MKISFLILLFSITLTAHAGDRLKDISGSMGKSIFSDKLTAKPEPNKREREEITEELKLQAERDAAQITYGERNPGAKDNSGDFVDKMSEEAKFQAESNSVQAEEDEPDIAEDVAQETAEEAEQDITLEDNADNVDKEPTEEDKFQAESDTAHVGKSESQIRMDNIFDHLEEEIQEGGSLAEIDIHAEINAQFEDLFIRLGALETNTTSVDKKPTQIFINKKKSELAKLNTQPIQTANTVNTLDDQACAKEKLYTLNVENLEQYESLEDFPYTYACVTQR